jgi:rhodanese-related sulfurtransferase
MDLQTITPQELRQYWRDNREIALLDVREEGPYSESHPFFAVSVPVSEIEYLVPSLVPRLSAPIVVYDNGEDYVGRAVKRISSLGYTSVSFLEGGLAGYSRVGEVFRDVNVPSKAFGELVESIRHTPSLPAKEVKAMIDRKENMVVVDARRLEEFNNMSIPTGASCPGGELVYRINDLVPSPDTIVCVNCAGRTRSIIGTQSLINAGMPNKVIALRNGTIGWTLDGLEVSRGQTQRVAEPSESSRKTARANAEKWAKHVGVPRINGDQLAEFKRQAGARTLHTLDVRDPEEYIQSHLAGFDSAPGGQLVQAIDEWVGVRGARIVLYDNDGVRARMTGSWLLQMGWDVFIVEDGAVIPDVAVSERLGRWKAPEAAVISTEELQSLEAATVVDLARSPAYGKGHIPGAWFASGPELARDIQEAPGFGPVVLTSPDGNIAAANVADAQAATTRPVRWLKGGTSAWRDAGLAVETEAKWLSQPIDVYKRPYEGTDNASSAMQAYIDWELQLVAQLANDGICGFHVVRGDDNVADNHNHIG